MVVPLVVGAREATRKIHNAPRAVIVAHCELSADLAPEALGQSHSGPAFGLSDRKAGTMIRVKRLLGRGKSPAAEHFHAIEITAIF
jgi:hypothetical protein